MNMDALIRSLAEDVRPVSRYAVGRRLAIGLAGGAVVTLIVVLGVLGLRPDIGVAMHGFSFWMKWIYTLSLGIGAIAMVARLARPDVVRLRYLWPIIVPVLILVGIGASQMAHAPPADWLAMWLGRSWKVCSLLVLTLAAPIFIGLLWSFRHLAPTRLRAAGAVSGLAAGSCAATLYCLHCPEVSALFVLTWYTLGIGLAAAAGALFGPRLLSW